MSSIINPGGTSSTGTVSNSTCNGRLSLVSGAPNYAIAPTFQAPSSANTTTEVLTFSSATGWATGTALLGLSTSGGVTANTVYYWNAASSTTGTIHTTIANAIAGSSAVNITANPPSAYFKPIGIGNTTLYFTPYGGNRIALYDGSSWAIYTFSELPITLSTAVSGGAMTAGKNYDVFAYLDSGSVAVELGAAWTNDTTRATAIVLQDGIESKSGDTTRRLVGTIRASETTAVEVTEKKMFVLNTYNQLTNGMFSVPNWNSNSSNTTWSTSTSVWTSINGGTDDLIEFLTDGKQAVQAGCFWWATGAAAVGIGWDTTSDVVGQNETAANNGTGMSAAWRFNPGYHYASMNVCSSVTFRADRNKLGAAADTPYTFIRGLVYG